MKRDLGQYTHLLHSLPAMWECHKWLVSSAPELERVEGGWITTFAEGEAEVLCCLVCLVCGATFLCFSFLNGFHARSELKGVG